MRVLLYWQAEFDSLGLYPVSRSCQKTHFFTKVGRLLSCYLSAFLRTFHDCT
jgi:hypothetical protein